MSEYNRFSKNYMKFMRQNVHYALYDMEKIYYYLRGLQNDNDNNYMDIYKIYHHLLDVIEETREWLKENNDEDYKEATYFRPHYDLSEC